MRAIAVARETQMSIFKHIRNTTLIATESPVNVAQRITGMEVKSTFQFDVLKTRIQVTYAG
jgi:hypothetical protein